MLMYQCKYSLFTTPWVSIQSGDLQSTFIDYDKTSYGVSSPGI